MKRFGLIIISLLAVLSVGLAFVPSVASAADANMEEICKANPDASVCKELTNPDPGGVPSIFQNIVNVLLFVAGIIAVIMIIVSGIRFTASHGDSSASQKARQTLIYSVIGLAIAVFAFAIVNFVLARLGNSDSNGNNGCPSGKTWNATTQKCE